MFVWCGPYLQYTNLCGWQIRVLALFQVFLRVDLSVEQGDRKAPENRSENKITAKKRTYQV